MLHEENSILLISDELLDNWLPLIDIWCIFLSVAGSLVRREHFLLGDDAQILASYQRHQVDLRHGVIVAHRHNVLTLIFHGPQYHLVLEVHFLRAGVGRDGAQLLSLGGSQGKQCLQTVVRIQPLVNVVLVDLPDFLCEATTCKLAERLPKLDEAEELVEAPGARIVQVQNVEDYFALGIVGRPPGGNSRPALHLFLRTFLKVSGGITVVAGSR